MPRQPHIHRRGSILLLTLFLLAIVAIALVGSAHRALDATVAAGEARDGLQRKWGVLSLEAALLPSANRLLGAQARRTTAVTLGTADITLTLSDEQAVPNLDAMLAESDAARITRLTSGLLHGAVPESRIRVTPWKTSVPAEAGPPAAPRDAILSLAQVVADASPPELLRLSAAVTCFGDGS